MFYKFYKSALKLDCIVLSISRDLQQLLVDVPVRGGRLRVSALSFKGEKVAFCAYKPCLWAQIMTSFRHFIQC